MDPIAYELELRTRQAGRQIAEDAAVYLAQIEAGIMGATDDLMGEIDRYRAIGNGPVAYPMDIDDDDKGEL